MLRSFLKNLIRRRPGQRNCATPSLPIAPVRLHVGGQIARPGWKILDVRPGPVVDCVGHCTDLSRFADESVAEIYASHVVEHLGYQHEVSAALDEFHRVLVPGGTVRIGVPDLSALCALYLDTALTAEERHHVMRMMFGGQVNSADYHHVGFNEELLTSFLRRSGFVNVARVTEFGMFDDASNCVFRGTAISLNVMANKPRHA